MVPPELIRIKRFKPNNSMKESIFLKKYSKTLYSNQNRATGMKIQMRIDLFAGEGWKDETAGFHGRICQRRNVFLHRYSFHMIKIAYYIRRTLLYSENFSLIIFQKRSAGSKQVQRAFSQCDKESSAEPHHQQPL
ncbi:MAG: hypothetical protein M8357_15350 [Desulfobulbaceae bacterium]|nr:hypothetical protein [Desulfobulbaceae bacterium]